MFSYRENTRFKEFESKKNSGLNPSIEMFQKSNDRNK